MLNLRWPSIVVARRNKYRNVSINRVKLVTNCIIQIIIQLLFTIFRLAKFVVTGGSKPQGSNPRDPTMIFDDDPKSMWHRIDLDLFWNLIRTSDNFIYKSV